MDSVTCCSLFGHKDLLESHLKRQPSPDARKVRGMGAETRKERWQLICFVALNSWWTCEAQSPVKILINMAEAYWLEVKYAHCSRCWLAQNGAIMFDNVHCKPFNQCEVLFCWILNTSSILHVSSKFIKLRNIIAYNWLATLISINMIQ